MKKRNLVFVTAVVAMIAMGCAGKKTSVEVTTTAQTQGETQKQESGIEGKETAVEEIKKPESVWWIVHDGLKEEDGTAQWIEEFEKKTDIKLKLDRVANNEYDQLLDLAFASGEIPDVFDLSMDNLALYAGQNAIADLTDLVENSDFYSLVDPSVWDSIRINGKIYGIPKEVQSPTCTYVRQDWLDRLGMEAPKTYGEFITMLERFKNEIPECVVPMTAIKQDFSRYMPEFFQGATTELEYVDGKWIDGMQQSNMETALSNARAAYENGLLDQEFITNTTANSRDQWYGGTVGVFNYMAGMWGKQLTERLQLNVPDAKVTAIAPIDGSEYWCQTGKLYCINAKLSDDEIASIFKYFLAYMHDGGEGQVLFQSGVEGLHWEQDGEYIKPLPSLSNPDDVINKIWINPWFAISEIQMPDKKNEPDEMLDLSLEIGKKYSKQNYVCPVSKTLQKINSDLTSLKKEIVAKVIMGDMSVEDGMKKYKEEADMLGVDKALEELNAAQ